MGATNHEHIWNVVQGERRLSLFEVSESRKDDRNYFASIDAELKKLSVMRRFMFELENTVIDHHLIYSSLVNKAKAQQAFYTPIPNRELALKLLRSGEIHLQIRDERNDVVTAYFVERSKWEDNDICIPSQLANQVIELMLQSGKFLESKMRAKDKRITVTEMVRQMGAERQENGKYPYTTVYVSHRGGQRAESGYIVPKLSVARRAFCEVHGLEYADIFDDSKVIPFKRVARSDNEPPF
jgi:hypothetical protein